MRIAPQTECEGCKQQIGNADYLLATDGVTKKIVAFHINCDPRDPDLQRHFKVRLEPVPLIMKPQGIG